MKSKLQFVDRYVTLKELVELLKSKLQVFTLHRYNVSYTSVTFDQLVSDLDESTIVKIQDFYENCTCYHRRSSLCIGIRSKQLSFQMRH